MCEQGVENAWVVVQDPGAETEGLWPYLGLKQKWLEAVIKTWGQRGAIFNGNYDFWPGIQLNTANQKEGIWEKKILQSHSLSLP